MVEKSPPGKNGNFSRLVRSVQQPVVAITIGDSAARLDAACANLSAMSALIPLDVGAITKAEGRVADLKVVKPGPA